MRKVELLAPAGDKDSLIAAIQNGADAIYLGGNVFNARAFAKNFSLDELKWAVNYAHLRDVKIYVTVNILYKDEEFDELIKYLDYLYDIQVDALIIQDLGLFYLVRNRYPDFEIHMSTQASVMNKYSAKYFKDNGATRVVLARENTIDEIKEIVDYTNVDLEVFVHGALCMGYSGQCLMSSMIGKRSGNKGQCAQPCRLEYKLKKDDEILKNNSVFLLSPKDLMVIDHIGELIDAGVTSFKIEGRMKRPEYVGAAVKAYRKAIDTHLNNNQIDLTEDKDDMKQMFNRDYTTGYLFKDKYISDGLFSGNRGIIIGKVLSYNKNKRRVVIKLQSDLKQEDSILFEDIDKGRPINKMFKNDRLINKGMSGDVVEIEFDFKVNKGNVRKIIDRDLIKKLSKTFDKEYKKVPIDIYFTANVNKHPSIKLKYKDTEVFIEADILTDKALKTPLDKERIEKQLNKLGDTPFYVRKCIIDIDDDIILPIKTINELRRLAVESLIKQVEDKKIHKAIKNDISIKSKNFIFKDKDIDVFVSDLKQLRIAMDYNFRALYYPYSKDALDALEICQSYNKDFALFIPRIVKSKELDEIKNSEVYRKVKKVVTNEIGAFSLFQDKEIILGTGMNIFNSYSLQSLDNDAILSLEMDIKQINELKYQNKIVQVYGKVENMISEFCPISQFYFNKQIKKCNKCKNGKYSLVDRKDEEFRMLMDEQCRMHLLNNKPLYFDSLNLLKTNTILLHFTDEDEIKTKTVLDDYFNNILYSFKSTLKDNIDYTNGYLQ